MFKFLSKNIWNILFQPILRMVDRKKVISVIFFLILVTFTIRIYLINHYKGTNISQNQEISLPKTKLKKNMNFLKEKIIFFNKKEYNFTSEGDFILSKITIATQLSEDRLNLLQMMTLAWKGSIHAAVYLNSSTLKGFKMKMKAIRTKFPSIFHRVYLNIMFHKNGEMYPMNKLRNFVIDTVKTPLLLYLDVDFIPSPNIHQILHELTFTNTFQNEILKNKAVLAFATFEWDCNDKKYFKTCVRGKEFLSNHPSQASTKFSFWNSFSHMYEIQYNLLYEPYVLGSINMPRYDPIFDIGNDKTSFAYELKASGYKFYVAPKTFVGHMPHDKDIKWSLEHKGYNVFEAWFKWQIFNQRIIKQYHFNMYCENSRYVHAPSCICKEYKCNSTNQNW